MTQNIYIDILGHYVIYTEHGKYIGEQNDLQIKKKNNYVYIIIMINKCILE